MCETVDSTQHVVINYCLSNVTAETRRQLRALDHVVVEDFCLQRCGDCFAGPFLLVDGQAVVGESHAQLIHELSTRSQLV